LTTALDTLSYHLIPRIRRIVQHKQTRIRGLADGEVRMILRSLVLTHCQRVTDGRTRRL